MEGFGIDSLGIGHHGSQVSVLLLIRILLLAHRYDIWAGDLKSWHTLSHAHPVPTISRSLLSVCALVEMIVDKSMLEAQRFRSLV